MHPFNLDHKDMQRRGVQTSQARRQLKRKNGRNRNGQSLEGAWSGVRDITFKLTREALSGFAFLKHTKKIHNARAGNK